MSKTHLLRKLFEGRVRLETQNDNPMIYARTYLQGRLRVFRTMHTNEHSAAKAAGDWYLALRHDVQLGKRLDAATFVDWAEKFIADCDAKGEPSELQRRNFRHKLNLLRPFIGDICVDAITFKWLEQLREDRSKVFTKAGKPVKPTTIKKDLMFISSVLGFCKEEGVIQALPDFPSFTGPKWGIDTESAPPFSTQQYKRLIRTAWVRMREPDLNPRTRRQRVELYTLIHVMRAAALRPSEAYSIRWRDAPLNKIAEDGLFHFLVGGKYANTKGRKPKDAFMTRVGYLALKRLFKQRDKATTTLDSPVFTEEHRDGFRALVDVCGLRVDKKSGRTRNLKSLRPTAITITLEAQSPSPDYRKTAKWARTSPAMLVEWYDDLHPEHAARSILIKKR